MIEFDLYQSADEDEMARFLGDVFAHRDPPALAVGITTSEFEAFVHLWGSKAAAEGLTVVARSSETGEMVGALLAEDSATGLPDGLEQLSEKFNPVFDILGQLDEEYSADKSVRPGESLHLFLLGVAQEFAGQGIGQKLVAECLANGLRKGYRIAVAEGTNRRSQHVLRKLGFVERVRRSYTGHRYEGRSFFLSIADEGGPMLMDRHLEP